MPFTGGLAVLQEAFVGAGAVAGTGATAAAAPSILASVAIAAAVSTSVSIGASFAIAALQSTPSSQDIGAIKDTQIFSSEEGSPIYRCFGERCRVGGTVLWLGELQYFRRFNRDFGVKVEEKIYQRDIVIGICHGPIEAITRVIANGIEISANPGDVKVTHTGFHVEPRPQDEYPGWTEIFNLIGVGIMRIHMGKNLIAPPAQDLEDFFVGGFLTTLGIPNDDDPPGFDGFFNNGAGLGFLILGTGTTDATDPFINLPECSDLLATGGSQYVDVFNPIVQIEHHQVAPGEDPKLITLDQTWQILSQLPGLEFYGRLFPYLGTEDQEPDGELQIKNLLKFGGCYPAYRGIAYVYIRSLQLKDFGSQIPKFEFEIKEKTGRTVGETIADMLELGGLAPDDYVIDSALDLISMRGYVIPGPTPMNKALMPLLRAFNIAVQETNEGRLRFMKRDAGVEWTIKEDDLAAHEMGEVVPRPLTITDVPDDTLPEQVNISYVDTSLGLQKGSQRERRINLTNRNIMKLDIPVTLTPADARAIAARELWLAVINRQKMNLRLPPSYLLIKENDILKITADGNSYRVIVTKVERGKNFIIDLEGYLESEEQIDFLGSPGEDGTEPEPITGIATLLPFIIDKGGPLINDHAGTLGFYALILNISTNPISEANLYVTVDEVPLEDGSNILFVAKIEFASDFGLALDLPSSTSKPGVWDTESSVTIRMKTGIILSATEDEVYRGRNWAMLGKEVIAYKTVTTQPDGTVKITNLLRGLQDTADEISTHALVSSNPEDPGAGVEMFIILARDNFTFLSPSPPEIIGSSLRFGAGPVGGQANNILWFDAFTYFGHSGRPFRVNKLEVRKKDGTNNLWITWAHSTSQHYRPFTSEGIPPFLPDREFYQIIILVGGVEKRLENRIVPYWVYNITDQTADGITPGTTTFTVEIYERANNGRSLVHSGVYVP